MQREVRAESGDISIHALRKESDPPQKQEGQHNDPISIHALRKESDSMRLNPLDGNLLFQSTLSVRRATYELPGRISDVKFQSTLSVRRATRWRRGMPGCMGISIHALRKESDSLTDFQPSPQSRKFQSTLSVRRATFLVGSVAAAEAISIHALRKESDRGLMRIRTIRPISIHALRKESDMGGVETLRIRPHFNPRSP